MKIKKIAYIDPTSELVATILSSRFKIKIYEYEDGITESDVLLLGVNTQHRLARSLSNLPIVVFDQHTDMYRGNLKSPGKISNINWIYWRLKDGSETHLVMPRYNPLPGILTIPAENKEKFHIYIVDETKESIIGNLDNGKSYELKPLSVRNLETLKKLKKQVSFDFDFLRDVKVEDAIDMLKIIDNERNLYDFWLDEPQDFETQVENCISIINANNSQDSNI